MHITWLGHSCFALESGGLRLVIDPFNPQMVGYPAPRVHADMVTVSHEHGDHNFVQVLTGNPSVLRGSGEHPAPEGWHITGYDSFHDGDQGSQRGKNTLFLIEAEGLRVLHCGDLGHLLAEDTIKAIGRVDVLMVPIGGFYTIDAAQAATLCRALDPRVILPMHYKTDFIADFPIADHTPFFTAMGALAPTPAGSLTLTASSLPAPNQTQIVLFNVANSIQNVDSPPSITIE